MSACRAEASAQVGRESNGIFLIDLVYISRTLVAKISKKTTVTIAKLTFYL